MSVVAVSLKKTSLGPIEQQRRTAQVPGDRFDFLFAFGCFDKQDVRTSVTVEMHTFQSAVETLHGPGIRSRNDGEIRGIASIDCCANFLHHLFGWNQLLAFQMPALFGSDLILDVNARDTSTLISLDRANDIHYVAVTRIGVS